jgi:hypothetical protein
VIRRATSPFRPDPRPRECRVDCSLYCAAKAGWLLRRIDGLADNFRRIIAVNRNLSFFTTGYNYLVQIIPTLIVARPVQRWSEAPVPGAVLDLGVSLVAYLRDLGFLFIGQSEILHSSPRARSAEICWATTQHHGR